MIPDLYPPASPDVYPEPAPAPVTLPIDRVARVLLDHSHDLEDDAVCIEALIARGIRPSQVSDLHEAMAAALLARRAIAMASGIGDICATITLFAVGIGGTAILSLANNPPV